MARKQEKRVEKRIRIRSKRLDEIDETKLALAVWLIAKGLVEDRTEPETEADESGNDAAPGATSGASP